MEAPFASVTFTRLKSRPLLFGKNQEIMTLHHALIVGFLTLLLLASCGSEPPREEVTFKNTDNTVYARLPSEPDHLNPLITINTYAGIVNSLLFSNLLAFDPQSLELEPQLAKAPAEITQIEEGPYTGGVAYTFEIFEEAAWDDGAPVTAHDVAFTLKALFNPLVNSGPIRSYLEFVRDIRIDPENPRRFTVLTDRPYIIAEAAISNTVVLPRRTYDPEDLLSNYALSQFTDPAEAAQLAQDADIQRFAELFNSPAYARDPGKISGSGAYRLETWETSQRIVLTRKKDWWADGLAGDDRLLDARPDKIVFRIVPEQVTALAALKDESLDAGSQLDTKDFIDLQQNEAFTRRFNLHSPPTLTYYYIGINTRDPKLTDQRVRRALAHLVDVDELIRSLYNGLAERTVGPFHPAKSYYHDSLPLIDFDLARARELLAEAGWQDSNGNGIVDKEIDGERTELKLRYLASAGSQFAQNLALLLQDNFRKAGIELTVDSKEYSVLIDDLKRRDFDLFGSGWGQSPVVDDPKQIWHTDSDTPDGANRVGFGDAESDALIEEIRVTLDPAQRAQLYRRFQEIVYEEQPYIFLFTPQERIVISKRFAAEPSVLRPGFFVNEFDLQIR